LQADKMAKDDAGSEDDVQELRERLNSDQGTEKPAPVLEAFVGTYVHPGYGTFKVVIRDEGLYIDATDRGFQCTFTFEHVRTWQNADEEGLLMRSNMIANIIPTRGSPYEHLESQFVLGAQGDNGQNVRATKMAILLDDTLPDGELIWFDRV